MSRGELAKGVTIRLVTAVVFGLIGAAAIYYALQMVAIFGEGMGVDARSREIYAHSHMIVHLFGAACALAIGVFHQAGNKLLRFLAIVAILTCGSYGILNMVGFTSTNRVSVAAAKDARNSAAERAYQAARADLVAQIKWLQSTAANEEGRERRRLLSEVDAKRKELSALKPPTPTAETVLSDPQASTLAELTGTSARQWLLALPVPLAILLFFAESFSFVVVGHMLAAIVALVAVYMGAQRASKPATSPVAAKDNKGGDGSASGGGGKVVTLQQPATAASQATSKTVAQPATTPRSELPVATAPHLATDLADTLARLRAAGMTWREIGSELGRDHTVLFRQFHGGSKAAKRHNASLGAMNRRNGKGPQPLYA